MEREIIKEEGREKTIVRRDPPREYAMLARVVYFLVDVIVVILALRLLFRAFGANNAGFAAVLYGLSRPLTAPFLAVFPAADIGGVTVEWGTLLGIAVYVLLGMLIVRLLRILLVRP